MSYFLLKGCCCNECNAKSCVEFVLQAMNNVDDEYLNVKIAVDYVGHKEIKRRERVYVDTRLLKNHLTLIL